MKSPAPSTLVTVLLAAVIAVLLATDSTVVHAAGLVTGKQIKDHSITGKDIKTASLTSADFKAGQLVQGPQGPQGPQGVQGVPGPSTSPTITTVTAATATDTTSPKDITVTCPTGSTVVGGGYVVFTTNTSEVGGAKRSYALDSHTWLVRAYNLGSSAWEVTVVAQCLS